MTVPGCARKASALDRLILTASLLALAAIWLAWSPAQAQTGDHEVTIDIPAQPLASALNSLALQANLQMLFEQAPVAGLTAPAIAGSMTPEQALHTLLAGTNLEFVHNADGAIIVRTKAATTTHHRNRPPIQTAAAPAPATVLAAAEPRTAREAEGPWLLRMRGVYLDPRNKSDTLILPGTPTGLVPRDDTRTNGRWAPEIDLEYFLSSHWSGELAINLPQVHDLELRNSTPTGGTVGNFRLMPNFLTVKYNFNPDGVFRPYLGAGLNVTSLYSVSTGAFGLSKTLAGPAAQAGFDIRLSEHWALNADVKWARVRPAVSFDDTLVGRMRVDPLLYGVGIGYRFGGSPPSAAPVAAAPIVAPPPPPTDSDGDGVPDNIDQCPNTPHGVQVDERGCPLDSDHDGVADYLDKCPGTPAGLKVDEQGCEVEELILKGVNFETNSATLTPQSSRVLDEVAAVLRQRVGSKAQIHGYTDSRGSDAFNQKLSERRAASVVAYLVAHGIAADSLSAKGFGKANPVASNDTAQGRLQNRRVTVEFSRPVQR
jgi:outer membrane protein OmpA-like peptidoglycan-associated protein/outer membrane protein W